MSIAEKLKSKTLELRKARDPLAPSFQFVLSDAKNQAIAKRLPDFDEEMAFLAVNRAINQAKEVLKDAPEDASTLAKLAAFESIMPAKASTEEVTAEAQAWVAAQEGEKQKAWMGALMKHLMDKFGASLERGPASQIVKEVLNG